MKQILGRAMSNAKKGAEVVMVNGKQHFVCLAAEACKAGDFLVLRPSGMVAPMRRGHGKKAVKKLKKKNGRKK